MPIRGSIEADYSKYVDECAKAEAGLAKIESQGKATETSLSSMEKAVSDGALSKSIENTVRSVDKAAGAAKASQTSFGQMSEGLRSADRVLNQFGVNLGPTIGSLDEFSQIATKTTGSLGAMGTAASVAGAALAGWKIGRWIADMIGADEAISDFASTLMGGGSVAAETYGAKLDTIQRAIRNGYEGLPTYTQAIEFNARAAAENAAQHVTSASMISQWTRELNNAKGGQAALRGEIDAGNLSVEQMKARFHVSAEAIAFLKKNMEAAKQETQDLARASEKAAAEAQKQADAMERLRGSMFGTDTIEKAQQYIAALGGVENLTRMSAEAQKQMNTVLGDAWDAYKRMGQTAPQSMRDLYMATIQLPPVVSGLGSEWASVGEKVTISVDSQIADMKRLQAEAAAYEAETQNMVQAYIDMQYGAGAAGAAGKQAGEQIDAGMKQATSSAQQLTQATLQNVAAFDALDAATKRVMQAQAAAGMMQAYSEATQWTGPAISMGGYEFDQFKKTGVPGAYWAAGLGMGRTSWADTSQPWGTGAGATSTTNTLNVNVNNADAQGIANKLVGEMKHQGYRL